MLLASDSFDMSAVTTNDPGSVSDIAFSLSVDRAARATFAPFFERSRAVSRPIPPDAPVTMTTLSCISIACLVRTNVMAARRVGKLRLFAPPKTPGNDRAHCGRGRAQRTGVSPGQQDGPRRSRRGDLDIGRAVCPAHHGRDQAQSQSCLHKCLDSVDAGAFVDDARLDAGP